MDGLETISDLMRRCRVREELFPKERMCPQGETVDAYIELRSASVELYSYIFEYEARCVCHLSLRSARRALAGVFETNGWTGILEKIEKEDKICASLVALFDKSKEHMLEEQQTQELIQQTKMLESFQTKFSERRQYDLEASLLKSLASDYKTDKDKIRERVNGTCEWFLQDERFHRWRDNESSSLLWISAGPGCGKSVLAKTLIDECLLASASALHTTTCYFFFKGEENEGEENKGKKNKGEENKGEENQRKKAAMALSAILHQLLDQNPELASNALPTHKTFGDELRNAFSELWEVLIKTAEDENAGHVICVLDALDECEAQSIQLLIDKIIGYYRDRTWETSSAVLKFLVTSRPYSRFRSAFEQLQGFNGYVHLDGDERSTEISNEINLVIDYRVPLMTQHFVAQDRERISSRLKEMENRTYLWLYLTLNVIDREKGKYSKASKIETLLSNLPGNVSAAYERILSQSDDIESARILLQIIIAADWPLSLAEVNVALTVATQTKKSQELVGLDLWPEESFRSTIQDICGLFVCIHDGSLSLIHQTARSFLLQTVKDESSHESSDRRKWSRCFSMDHALEVLCSICVEYLTLNDFTKQTASSKQREGYTSTSSGALAFFHYAAKGWFVHYGQAPQQKGGLHKLAIALCTPDSNPVSYWLPLNSLNKRVSWSLRNGKISDWSAIGIASVVGLADVVQHFLAAAKEVDQRAGKQFGTAVRVAIAMERLEIVHLLCQYNTSAQFQQDLRSGYSALRVPATDLSRDAEPTLQNLAKLRLSEDLAYAISNLSSPEVMRILLDHGADPSFRDDEGATLLSSLISNVPMVSMHKEFGTHLTTERIRLLLESRADPNMQSKTLIRVLCLQDGDHTLPPADETPISLAKRRLERPSDSIVSKEFAEIIQLLRNAGAEEDIEETIDEGEYLVIPDHSGEEAPDEEEASSLSYSLSYVSDVEGVSD